MVFASDDVDGWGVEVMRWIMQFFSIVKRRQGKPNKGVDVVLGLFPFQNHLSLPLFVIIAHPIRKTRRGSLQLVVLDSDGPN
jgi:hypothetical protein